MEEEDFAIINLCCKDCDNMDCGFAYHWLHPDSEEGCRRKVSQEVADEYMYRMSDYPFLMRDEKVSLDKKIEAYNEQLDWLDNNIYNATYAGPIGRTRKLI